MNGTIFTYLRHPECLSFLRLHELEQLDNSLVQDHHVNFGSTTFFNLFCQAAKPCPFCMYPPLQFLRGDVQSVGLLLQSPFLFCPVLVVGIPTVIQERVFLKPLTQLALDPLGEGDLLVPAKTLICRVASFLLCGRKLLLYRRFLGLLLFRYISGSVGRSGDVDGGGPS